MVNTTTLLTPEDREIARLRAGIRLLAELLKQAGAMTPEAKVTVDNLLYLYGKGGH